MKQFPHILAKVVNEWWTITEKRHYAILSALESRLSMMDPPEDDDMEMDEFDYFEQGEVAVIPIHGVLGKHLSAMEMICGGCSMDKIAGQISAAESNPVISKVLFYINSPGGTYTGTPELSNKIAAMRKPTMAFTDAECCSGAFWTASQARQFYCSPSAEVGNVGVRMVLFDESKRLKDAGITVNAISSGQFKLAGASFKPLTDEERAMFQAQSDSIFEKFKAAIKSNRPDAQDEALEGQIFRGEEAVNLGLVDGIVDDLDEAIRVCRELR